MTHSSRGCIALTDPDWYRYLSGRPHLNEVNFWQPHGDHAFGALALVEGSRILRECMERAIGGLHYWNIDANPRLVAVNFARYGAAVEVHPRLGQGLFSAAVRDAYKSACAVTHEHSLPAIEATHIRPHGLGGEHRIDNGLLLRSDLHRLCDRGYVTVTPDYVFHVGDSLGDDFKNGRSYYGLDGLKIALPDRELWRPSRELLEWHKPGVCGANERMGCPVSRGAQP